MLNEIARKSCKKFKIPFNGIFEIDKNSLDSIQYHGYCLGNNKIYISLSAGVGRVFTVKHLLNILAHELAHVSQLSTDPVHGKHWKRRYHAYKAYIMKEFL